MCEPVLVVSNCYNRRLAVTAVPFDCVTGEAGSADAMELTLQGLRHICRIAERQLVASKQQRMDHCQQSLLGLWDEPRACSACTAGQTACMGLYLDTSRW